MDFTSWLLAAVVIQIIVMLFGTFIIKKFSAGDEKTLNRKLAALSILPLLVVLILYKPVVVDYFPDELFENTAMSENSNNIDLHQVIKEQSSQIRSLVTEIKQLNKDITEVNEYYGKIIFFLLIAAVTICISFVAGRNEIDPDKIEKFPLGLREKDENNET